MSGGCGGSGMASPSPAGPSDESGSGEWRRIYERVEALLPQVESSLAQAEASRRRWKEAYIELPLLANPKIIELKENDLKDYRTCEDDDSSQLKEAGNNAELIQSNEGHEGIVGELRAELRKLKEAHETLISNKDKEICVLVGVKEFLWNQLRTIDRENTVLLKIKEGEVARATEAAQMLQHNIEELQVAARYKDDKVGRLQKEAAMVKKRTPTLDGKLLEIHSLVKEKNKEIQKLNNENMTLLKIKELEAAQATEAAQKLQHNIEEMQVAARDKDDKVGRLQAESINAEKKILILDGKLLGMHSLVKEKNDEIQKLKCASSVPSETSHKCSKDIYSMYREEYTEISEESNEYIDEMDDEYTIFVKIHNGSKIIALEVAKTDTIHDIKAKIQYKEGIPSGQQRLMFGDESLNCTSSLKELNIWAGDRTFTLHIVLQGMHIFVKMLPYDWAMTLEIERAYTVYRLKAKIFDHTGRAPAEQHLIFAGKELEEGRTLADYDIQDDSMIHLEGNPRSDSWNPIPLYDDRRHLSVSTQHHAAIIERLVMLRSQTIGDIKFRIYVELNIPTDQQCLSTKDGKPLEDGCTLEELEKCGSGKLFLRLRLPGACRLVEVGEFRLGRQGRSWKMEMTDGWC